MIMKIEKILAYLTTTVAGLPAFSAFSVERDEYKKIPVDQLPYLYVFPVKDVKENLDEYFGNYVENRILTVGIDLRTSVFPVSVTTIPLQDAICNAIKADPSLGYLALETRIHTLSWAGENSGDGQIASAGIVLEILYRTEA